MKESYKNDELILNYDCDIRPFLEKIKQPTENKVKNALIVTITDKNNGIRLSYKCGGGSISDNIFSSSLAIQDDDEWIVAIKFKNGKSLNDVLITSQLFENYHDSIYIDSLRKNNELSSTLAFECKLRYKYYKKKNEKIAIHETVDSLKDLIYQQKITTDELDNVILFLINNKNKFQNFKIIYNIFSEIVGEL